MTEQIKFEFVAKAHPMENCAWHFFSFPKELSKEIRELFKWKEEGWGRMKVTLKVGSTEWKTSIWFDTKQETYWFPVKAAIRKKENIEENKDLKVCIWL